MSHEEKVNAVYVISNSDLNKLPESYNANILHVAIHRQIVVVANQAGKSELLSKFDLQPIYKKSLYPKYPGFTCLFGLEDEDLTYLVLKGINPTLETNLEKIGELAKLWIEKNEEAIC